MASEDAVRELYAEWLADEESVEGEFTPEQRWWLDEMVAVVVAKGKVTADDLDLPPFSERGGLDAAVDEFGGAIGNYLEEFTELTQFAEGG